MLTAIKVKNILQKIQDRKLSQQAENAIEKLINTYETTWNLLEKKQNKDYDELINIVVYSTLISNDIRQLVRLYLNERKIRSKNQHGRNLCVILIEFFDGINFLLGKELRISLEGKGIYDYSENVKELNKSFSKLKKKYSVEMRAVRNTASAHLSKNSKVLIKYYKELPIGETELAKVAIDTCKLSNLLVSLSTSIILLIVQLKSDDKNTGSSA